MQLRLKYRQLSSAREKICEHDSLVHSFNGSHNSGSLVYFIKKIKLHFSLKKITTRTDKEI